MRDETTDFSVRDTQVVVVGAARSGIAAARLLASRGGRVVLTDLRDTAELRQAVGPLTELGVTLELGGHRDATLAMADLVVLSPGVPPHLPVLDHARRRGTSVISEVELASRWLQGPVVAITGTKGKSTTAVVAGRMLESDGRKVLVGGNIGAALSAQVERSTPEVVHIVETSSFQLELTETFRPSVAVFLNLSTDHLDRHRSFREYAAAKARIFANQTETDSMVINADDPQVLELARQGRARRMVFAAEDDDRHACDALDSPAGAVVVSDDMVIHRSREGERPLFPLAAIKVEIRGRHLVSDVLAAAAVSTLADVSPDSMRRGVESFSGLEHALQLVADVDGVRFVNDSKATNVVAAQRAIESVGDRVVVIMGGQFKGGDLGALAGTLATRAHAVVAIGQARPQFVEAFGGVVHMLEAETMDEAVRTAFRAAHPGGVVLLAPACASFDMFRDYADRGRAFEAAVQRVRDTPLGSRQPMQ